MEIFIASTVAGMGLALGVAAVLGWILMIRYWIQPDKVGWIISF